MCIFVVNLHFTSRFFSQFKTHWLVLLQLAGVEPTHTTKDLFQTFSSGFPLSSQHSSTLHRITHQPLLSRSPSPIIHSQFTCPTSCTLYHWFSGIQICRSSLLELFTRLCLKHRQSSFFQVSSQDPSFRRRLW